MISPRETTAVLFAGAFHGLLAMALGLVGATTGSATAVAAAVFAAMATVHAGLAAKAANGSPTDAGARLAAAYGIGALLFASGAGAVAAIGIHALGATDPVAAPGAIYAALAFAVIALGGALYVSADSFYAGKRGLGIRDGLAVTVAPEFSAIAVAAAAALIAMAFAILGLLFADRGGIPGMDGVTALGIGAIMAVLAEILFTAYRNATGTFAVPDALRAELIRTVATEAQRQPAISTVDDITAHRIGPGQIQVGATLGFKSGIDARHISGIVDKLAQGIRSAHPAVTAVVLVPNRPKTGHETT